MKKKLLIILLIFSSLSFSQTKNFDDFLQFAKKGTTEKNFRIKQNNWIAVKQTEKQTVGNTTTENTFYSKNIDENNYYFLLQVLTNNQTNSVINKTSLKLPNGRIFNEWISEIEKMGYAFKKDGNQKGKLITGKIDLMIIAEIDNIESSEENWSYEISVIIPENNKSSTTSIQNKNSEFPISNLELEEMKKKYDGFEFNKDLKIKWEDEYISQGFDDDTVKFSCKWSKDGYVTGIFHFEGKYLGYYGKENIGIAWSGNRKDNNKFEGVIQWNLTSEPLERGRTMILVKFYTKEKIYTFNMLTLSE